MPQRPLCFVFDAPKLGLGLLLDTALFAQGIDPRTLSGVVQVRIDGPGILQLARRHYGFFDPFVIGNGRMMVRNAEATSYGTAMNARAIRAAIKSEGVTLAVVMHRMSQDVQHEDAEIDAPQC